MDSQMCDIGTPPKPSTNTEKQHPHPRDESPVYAGEGNGQESIVMEKGKKKKKWWKVTNFFRSLRKQLKGSSNSVQVEVEQPQKQQESEQVKPQNECKARCSDDYTVNHNQLDDQLCECVLGAEAKRLEDDPEVSVEHLNKTDEDVEGIYVLEYPQPLPEDIALNILANRGPDSHVCESKVEEKVKEKKKKKKKKKWWKLTSFFRACKKHRKSSSNPVEGELPEEQEQQIEEVKPQIECKARCSDDYTVNHNQLNDQLSKCGLGAEVRRLEDGLEDDPEVSVEHLNKTDEDVEGIYILGYPHRLPEDIALNILEKRGPDSHVCDLSTPPKPSINVEEKHSHPHNETPVDAVEGNGRESKVEEKAKETRKKKKKWWRLTSFFRTIKNLGMSSTNPVEDEAELPEEQPQEQEVQEQQNVEEKSDKKWKARCSDAFIFSQYQLGDLLGKGGFGTVYEARRLQDGLKVAVKYVDKTKRYNKGLYLPGYRKLLPMEIALTILANKGPREPEIIEMLGWKDYIDHYVMILECPSPCETVDDLVCRLGGSLNESLARKIMSQATRAAYVCCRREVFHRDIKMSNLLINKETLEVKLIDFGCGDILKATVYKTYSGTEQYCPPEFYSKGQYHGKSATVWSLGVLLFRMVTGQYLDFLDLHMFKRHLWFKADLSKECCRLLHALLQENPKKRIDLKKILFHNWFLVTT